MREALFLGWSWTWVAIEVAILIVLYRWLIAAGNPKLGLLRTIRATFWAGVASAVLCVAQATLGQMLGFGRLSTLTAVVLWTAAVPPVWGMVTLVSVVRRLPSPVRWPARAAAVLGLLAAPACAYATLVEPWWVEVTRTDVVMSGMPADATAIKVVVLADIQTNRVGNYERRVLDLVKTEKPDLLLLPGDFFQCLAWQFERSHDDFVELLRSLKAIAPVFACPGNIDHPGQTASIFAEAGVRLLRDETEIIEIHGVRVAIGGTEFYRQGPYDPALLHQLRYVNADVRLLMNHTPDAVLRATPADRVDLIVSGHTHGGQVVLPGFGPLLKASSVPRAAAAGGLHQVGQQPIYVSRGVGMERLNAPPLRFWCRPELAVLTLRGTSRTP
ncbi:MAG: metallophosphoesterase [Phycisphaerae bacterium]|nr:metallophosphoesterase [Phycisphaerae bacterium]